MPPDILNEHEPNSLEGGVANEAGNVQLVCQATGVPEPTVQWRRENGKDIVVRTEGREKQGNLWPRDDERAASRVWIGEV